LSPPPTSSPPQASPAPRRSTSPAPPTPSSTSPTPSTAAPSPTSTYATVPSSPSPASPATPPEPPPTPRSTSPQTRSPCFSPATLAPTKNAGSMRFLPPRQQPCSGPSSPQQNGRECDRCEASSPHPSSVPTDASSRNLGTTLIPGSTTRPHCRSLPCRTSPPPLTSQTRKMSFSARSSPIFRGPMTPAA